MNTRRSRDRKQPDRRSPEERAMWERVRQTVSVQRVETRQHAQLPKPLPDLWLMDSEALLAELARIRDLLNRVPLATLAVSLPLHSVRDALWRLEEQLRGILRVHRQMQTAFAQKAEAHSQTQHKSNVIRMSET